MDDLPPVARKKTNRSVFPMIGTATILLSNLVGFSAIVNRPPGTAQLQFYNRVVFSAGFATAPSAPPIGTIRPSRIAYSTLSQRMRFEPKLVSQTTK